MQAQREDMIPFEREIVVKAYDNLRTALNALGGVSYSFEDVPSLHCVAEEVEAVFKGKIQDVEAAYRTLSNASREIHETLMKHGINPDEPY